MTHLSDKGMYRLILPTLTGDIKEELKTKLWTAIDSLSEEEGFVLVATEGDISFTPLKAGGWSEHVLEIEPLEHASLRKWNGDLQARNRVLEEEAKSLQSKISVKSRQLKDIETALAKALGK